MSDTHADPPREYGAPRPNPFAKLFDKPWKIVTAIVVVIAIVVGISYASWRNKVNNEGRDWQERAVVLYQGVERELSTCLDTSQVVAQVAAEERESLKDLMFGTAAARYQNDSSAADAQNVGLSIDVKSVQENYPSVTNELYKELISTVVGCRKQVSGTLGELQAYAGEYRIWIRTGGLFAKHVRNNWPHDDLTFIGVGGVKLTGMAALNAMAESITTGQARKALQTHTMPDQDLFNHDDEPSPGTTHSLGKLDGGLPLHRGDLTSAA